MADHPLKTLIDAIIARDKNAIEDMNGYYSGGPTIENRIALADGRGEDALRAVIMLANYIIAKEQSIAASAKGEE